MCIFTVAGTGGGVVPKMHGSGDRGAPIVQATPRSTEVVVPSCLVFSRRMLRSDF